MHIKLSIRNRWNQLFLSILCLFFSASAFSTPLYTGRQQGGLPLQLNADFPDQDSPLYYWRGYFINIDAYGYGGLAGPNGTESRICFPLNIPLLISSSFQLRDLPLYYWQENFVNFGDYISLKLIERITRAPVQIYQRKQAGKKEKKLLAIGSIMTFAADDDVIWGSGVNGNWLGLKNYKFTNLDVRAVRGPLTRSFLTKNFGINCPDVYGDPALLFPYFFPELKRAENPSYEYLIIPHYSEQVLFPKEVYPNVVYATEPWDTVIKKILDSKFVISSSLHGIIIAEAYGIPARLLRLTNNEHIFKYVDYYLGTNRPDFRPAFSLYEAIQMGGERSIEECDLSGLYQAFPFEFWPNTLFQIPHFSLNRGERE